MKFQLVLAIAFATVASLGSAVSRAQPAIVPKTKSTHVLVASADTPSTPYLAFPALLELEDELLVSFKRGRAHAADPNATLDMVRINRSSGRVKSRSTLAHMQDHIMQMGEWVRFPNGDIANYIDAQKKGAPSRIGLRVVRSGDDASTFSPLARVGAIDGIEYGYAFEAVSRDQTTWMLVMTFTNLSGGGAVHRASSQPGSVDVIRSDDNGKSWRFVKSITAELGQAPINESSIARHGDGFIIAARGYDKRQWLLRTDAEFNVQAKVDLASSYPFIQASLGRPRVFSRDGAWYLLARNTIKANSQSTTSGRSLSNPMRLSLFKFSAETLAISKHVLLDNAEADEVADGYYAVPYWSKRDGRTLCNIVTYKRLADSTPDIIRLEYDWDEIR